MKKIAIILAVLALVLYGACGAAFYFLQDSLIFYPTTYPPGELEAQAVRDGYLPWVDSSGRQIGWQSRDGRADDVVLAFHGQGGHALMLSFLRQYSAGQGGDRKIYLLEYPGNGNRPGIPSEKSFTAAGIEAIDLLAAPDRRIAGSG